MLKMWKSSSSHEAKFCFKDYISVSELSREFLQLAPEIPVLTSTVQLCLYIATYASYLNEQVYLGWT